MSYDRQIEQICPHIVRQEALYLEPGGRTIKPLRPIASTDSVRVRLNGLMDVPMTGAYAPGRVVGTKSGPFVITQGVNDVLVVKVGDGDVVRVQIPPANNIATDRLIERLNVIPGLHFTAVGHKISLRTVNVGWGATTSFRSGSTLAATLGFAVNRIWRGRTLSPAWTLVGAPRTLQDRPMRWIVFDEAHRGFSDYVEIDYSTVQQECRRCGGVGIEHDWRYAGNGALIKLRDEALLQQEILKIIYTIQGSNIFHPWYGTVLVESLGTKILNGALVQSTLAAAVQQGFQRWQSIKKQQEEAVGQVVSDREYPYLLTEVSVKQSTRDMTVMFVSMTVQNRSAQPFQLTRGVKIPQPDDLLGSTQSQGILRQIQNNLVLAE